ncbi:MAG TPA: hypothetical protein VKT30_11190 [Caulobacteraceae bacterium]|nr:hypothetical protein [Caulobacteraceae bacterium]
MTHAPDPAPDEYSIPDNLGEIRLFPRPVVWAAAAVIAAMAGVGLVQGLRGAIAGGAAGSNQEEISTSGAVSAQAAQPLSANPQWSALSGAAMASSSAASSAASSSAESEQEDVTSESAGEESAAAPPPIVQVPSAGPAAPAQPPASSQPDTMPPT